MHPFLGYIARFRMVQTEVTLHDYEMWSSNCILGAVWDIFVTRFLYLIHPDYKMGTAQKIKKINITYENKKPAN